MATNKRPVEEILSETLPTKSKGEYIKAWKAFREYLGHENKPTDSDY